MIALLHRAHAARYLRRRLGHARVTALSKVFE